MVEKKNPAGLAGFFFSTIIAPGLITRVLLGADVGIGIEFGLRDGQKPSEIRIGDGARRSRVVGTAYYVHFQALERKVTVAFEGQLLTTFIDDVVEELRAGGGNRRGTPAAGDVVHISEGRGFIGRKRSFGSDQVHITHTEDLGIADIR